MGNNCSCFRDNYHSNTEELDRLQHSNLILPNYSALKANEKSIAKIQAVVRGYLARKTVNKLMNEQYKEKVNEQLNAYSSALMNFNTRNQNSFYYGYDDENEEYFKEKEFRGTTKLENDAIYFGEWVGNVRFGKGILSWPDGSKYEANGRGRLIQANGEIYEGVEKWPDGSRYEGEYKNGKKSGKGRFCWADGSSFEGDFLDNNIHGIGKYIWADGRVYEGAWVHNKREGQGVLSWPEGTKYSGEFKSDLKDGTGCLEFPDGRKYIGSWKNDKQHGQGVFVMSNGNKNYGRWEDGKKME